MVIPGYRMRPNLSSRRVTRPPKRFRTSPEDKPVSQIMFDASNEDLADEEDDEKSQNLLDDERDEDEDTDDDDSKRPLTDAEKEVLEESVKRGLEFANSPDSDLDLDATPKENTAQKRKKSDADRSEAEKFANLDKMIANDHPSFRAGDDEDDKDEDDDEDDNIVSTAGSNENSNGNSRSSTEKPKKKRRAKQPEPPSCTKRAKGKNWPPIFEHRKGSKVPKFILFERRDPRDVAFAAHLAAMERLPPMCKGRTIKEWENIADHFSQPSIVDGRGHPLFPSGIGAKQLKTRFEQIYSGTKKWIKASPWRSGHDDEAGDDDPFVANVEDFVSRMIDYEEREEADKNETNAERKQRTEEAKAMRDAALGDMSAADVKAMAARGKAARAANAAAAAAAACSSRKSFGELGGIAADNDDEGAARQERLRAKEENRARIIQAKINLKREELRMRNEEQKAARESQERMLTVLVELVKSKNTTDG